MTNTSFLLPKGIASINFSFSADAIEWLSQSTATESGRQIDHRDFFSLLLSKMRFDYGAGKSFHHPVAIGPRQAQISVKQLAELLGSGRKQLTNLLNRMETVGLIEVNSSDRRTIIKFVCVEGFEPVANV